MSRAGLPHSYSTVSRSLTHHSILPHSYRLLPPFPALSFPLSLPPPFPLLCIHFISYFIVSRSLPPHSTQLHTLPLPAFSFPSSLPPPFPLFSIHIISYFIVSRSLPHHSLIPHSYTLSRPLLFSYFLFRVFFSSS